MTLIRVVLIPRYGVFRLPRLPTRVVILNNILWTIALFLVSVIYILPFIHIKWPCACHNRYHFLRYVVLPDLYMIHDCLFFLPVGDWAGSSYATSGCPGTCSERLMEGANFVVSQKNTHNANMLFFIHDVTLLECDMEYKLFESIQKATNRRKWY